MRLLRVNRLNDIFTVNGRLAISTDLSAVTQNCEHAIKAQLGEMIYAQERGVNTFDSVWGGSPNVVSFEASARQALTRVENVLGVEAFEARVSGDVLRYTATIRTTFGLEAINGQL